MIPDAAVELFALNRRLDDDLLGEIDRTDPAMLRLVPAAGEWCLAQLYAHLGEFPHFFANEIRRWHNDPGQTVGRTIEHPARLAAVADPSGELRRLREAVSEAFADLTSALELLQDRDIASITRNVKYGAEPMTAFLDRYVIGHKAGHLEQVRSTKALVA